MREEGLDRINYMITPPIIRTLEQIKFNDTIEISCDFCKSIFQCSKRHLYKQIKNNKSDVYCSRACAANARNKAKNYGTKQCQCKNCNAFVKRVTKEIKKSKSGNIFCSVSCAATYNNKNKVYGIKRAKLEVWLESKLRELFPVLEFHFNRKNAINSELDIYIPSLKLAFELNGIFHYEPIYGSDKLKNIQNNDNRKFQACLEQNIELCIIDTSQQIRFTESSSVKYLNIIKQLINSKLLAS